MAKTAAETKYVRDLDASLPAGTYRCNACGLFKGAESFSPPKYKKPDSRKVSYNCKACRNSKQKAYVASFDPERRKAYRRNHHLMGNYGITQKDYDDMVAKQGGRCAICQGDDPKHSSGKWNVDHNHTTGAVRSLLCSPCNVSIGHFQENPQWLRAAADYLEGHDENA